MTIFLAKELRIIHSLISDQSLVFNFQAERACIFSDRASMQLLFHRFLLVSKIININNYF